jgi:hypothetical protein
MGLDFKSAEFLCTEVRRGISPGCLLVLGRPTVYMAPREIAKVRAWTGVALKPSGFADEFFRALGAERASPSWADRLAARSATLAELQARWRSYRGSRHRRLSNRAFFRKLGASLL